MRKNYLESKGLTLSAAQSISNVCNQRAILIEQSLFNINNVEKSISVRNQPQKIRKIVPIPDNVEDLLKEKAQLHALQAFLMEHIKMKEALINEAKAEVFNFDKPLPEFDKLEEFTPTPLVDEQWGLEQLSKNEIVEWFYNEAYAAHIGQFIHRGGKLHTLREELGNIPDVEFIELETGKKTVVSVKTKHSGTEMLKLHEKLAKLHRGYEGRLNYLKAKVKNLVSAENSRISKENAQESSRISSKNEKIEHEMREVRSVWINERDKARHEFESKRHEKIQKLSSLRIAIPSIFQSLINDILEELKDEYEN